MKINERKYKKYVKYRTKKYHLTKQGYNSDIGKQAKKIVNKRWGGSQADGRLDMQMPEYFFKYKKKTIPRKGKKLTQKRGKTYHYPTYIRKKWKSYGKVYKR